MGSCAGAFAEMTTFRDGFFLPVPENLTWIEAAATPVTFVSAWDALTAGGGLAPGATVLVNAASSGVGVAALQVARLLGAATIVASSTTRAKLDRLAAEGLHFDTGVVAGDPDYVERCLAATAQRGFDVTLDSVGAPAMPAHVTTAAIGGRIVSIGRLGGGHAQVNLHELARKRVSLVGTTFRTRTPAMLAAMLAAAGAVLLPALADRRLRPVIDRVFPLDDAAVAEDYLARAEHLGKVVLSVP
jgi:NADPH2:quinone reductase